MLSIRSFPKAIIHVDGDAFFVSCEAARDPRLRGKPVVTGGEKGIVSAMSYEAKARGIVRAMPVHQARIVCPEVIVVSSDFTFYKRCSERMVSILQRYTPTVEAYSIDECFADITGLRRPLHMSYEQIAEAMKRDLQQELGMTFSLGLSITKVLAKVASKHNKPDGFTVIRGKDIQHYLKDLPVGKVWGIGSQTAQYLHKLGVITALQFVEKPEWFVVQKMAKPHIELWHELRGTSLWKVHEGPHEMQHSVSRTGTFKPPTREKAWIFAHLVRNVERACLGVRKEGARAKRVSWYVKTQDFHYIRREHDLPLSTAVPQDILKIITPAFEESFDPELLYRSTGVTLSGLAPVDAITPDLFGNHRAQQTLFDVTSVIDQLGKRYKAPVIRIAAGIRVGEHIPPVHQRLAIPIIGKVR